MGPNARGWKSKERTQDLLARHSNANDGFIAENGGWERCTVALIQPFDEKIFAEMAGRVVGAR